MTKQETLEKTIKKPKAEDAIIPRFVLSLTDTAHTITGPQGEQYYSITIAAPTLLDFWKKSKSEHSGKMNSEIKHLFSFFGEEVAKMDKEGSSGFTQVAIKNGRK